MRWYAVIVFEDEVMSFQHTEFRGNPPGFGGVCYYIARRRSGERGSYAR